MKKIKFTDETKSNLNAALRDAFPNEAKETLEWVLSDFIYDAKENEWDFADTDELKWDLQDYAKKKILESTESLPDFDGKLTVQETVFCREYLKTHNPSKAYAASHKGCTYKPDSVRSLASRFMRRPNVAAYIQAALDRVRQSTIESCIWSREQSLLERRDKLNALNADIEARNEAIKKAIELIQNDESLSNADKAQRIIQATQRPIYGRDTIEAHKALCDSLDNLTWTNDGKKSAWYEISNEPVNSWEQETKRDAEYKAQRKKEAEMFPGLANFFD